MEVIDPVMTIKAIGQKQGRSS